MSPLLEANGIRVVALSKDEPEAVAAQQQRDALRFTLLSDAHLEVIEQFGLLHEGAIEFAISGTVFGIPLGLPTGFKRMAIPTTLLIDEHGVVRWIDQADDYRLRGDEKRIADAVAAAFPAR